MSRNHKKGRHSNKRQPCPVCGNTKGSCKINDDGSIYCFHSTPNPVPLTIRLSSFTDDTSRQQQLQNLSSTAPNKELQFLLMGERCRTQQLTEKGVRKPKKLRLYCTYTIETNSTGTTDAIEKILSKVERSWKSFTGEINELQFIAIERLIHNSFTDGFQLWEQLMSNG
ncbi:MAG: hypothetical protein WBA41_12150 [Rivularia sp. (in: cyanobacteria)]